MSKKNNKHLRILLADDDQDDRFLFDLILKKTGISAELKTVSNGEMLMKFLKNHKHDLPDLLFLDLNMPIMNGNECLVEIKATKTLSHLPVIIYSTSLRDEIADILYNKGAHFYLQKSDTYAMQGPLASLLKRFYEGTVPRPARENFILHTRSATPDKYY